MQTMPLELLTLGKLQTVLNLPWAKLQPILRELSVVPSVVINGQAHYSGEDCERIRTHLEQSR
jgi:hypothetical protein